MKKWLFTLIAVPALLVGCGEKEKPATSTTLEEPQMLEVEILTPKEVEVNTPIELGAHVIQGEKNIDDAIVEFEVWESGKRDEGQMLEGKLEKDGVYKAQTTFDHDGVYFMFAHTTANGIHNMPKQQITAGTPDMTQVIEEDEKANMNMSDHGKDSSEDTEH
ncbi:MULTISPECIES: FixH family protein [unclassified Lysinibacillus]|uniref:FixH family protein n=1 Tax=unclassified Lysinibacillus TaxID=2636778 RepID=UPI0030FC4885